MHVKRSEPHPLEQQQAVGAGHERPDALLKALCKPRNAPEAYDTMCPAGPGLLYDRHHKSACCLSPGEADNVLILQTMAEGMERVHVCLVHVTQLYVLSL